MMKQLLALLTALFTLFPLIPQAALAEEPLTLRVAANGHLDEDILAAYTALTGVRVEQEPVGDIMDVMANAFAIRNDQVDLFVFTAHNGLYAIKEHGYFAPLEGSEILAGRLDDLYPVFREALSHDGHMVGWIINAQPLCYVPNTALLTELGLAAPETFDQLLDLCHMVYEEDLLDSETSLFDMYSYTAESMMGLFMNQYIMACGLNGGLVDFTRSEFARIAEKIRAQVPKKAQSIEDYDYLFNMGTVHANISTEMLATPKIFADQSAVETFASVITVNPYAAQKEAAIAFLEYYACQTNAESYVYDASLTQPYQNEYQAERIRELTVQITLLSSLEEPTSEQQDQLADLLAQKANAEQWLWSITAEDVAFYQEFVGHLSMSEASPVQYDEALRASAGLFLNGAYDAAAFARACQEHVDMIYQEHGISLE